MFSSIASRNPLSPDIDVAASMHLPGYRRAELQDQVDAELASGAIACSAGSIPRLSGLL